MKLGIVYPILNQFELAIKAMESVKTQHDWQPFIMPQYDNQIPLAAAWNEGIRRAIEARCDYIIVSNDDVIYSPWTLDGMIEEFEKSPPEVILVSAVNDAGAYPDPNMIRYAGKPTVISTAEHPDFSCFVVKKDFFEHFGTFDENIFPAYHEDNEAHIRLNVLGYKAICTTAAPYYHYGSASQKGGANTQIVDHRAFNMNGNYVFAKWGTNDAARLFFKFPFNDPQNDPRVWKREWRNH